MVWTPFTRAEHNRSGLHYPSDFSDAEWRLIAPLLPAAKRGGRPRSTDMRAVMNGIFYLLASGCQWALLPKDFPPRSTVYHYFKRLSNDGTLARIHDAFYCQTRDLEGKLTVDLVGDLAGILSIATNRDKSAVSMDLSKCQPVSQDTSKNPRKSKKNSNLNAEIAEQVKLVAGVRSGRNGPSKGPKQVTLVAGVRERRSLLHVAWDITATERKSYPIDYDALLGLPSPYLP
jgi:transposase